MVISYNRSFTEVKDITSTQITQHILVVIYMTADTHRAAVRVYSAINDLSGDLAELMETSEERLEEAAKTSVFHENDADISGSS